MNGPREKPPHRSVFDNQPGVKHAEGIADLGHHAKVVSDKQQRRVMARLHLCNQAQDLFLYGYIQRRCGFIRDDQPGFRRKGGGDQNMLAHVPARVTHF